MIAGIWTALKALLTGLGLIRDLEQARNTPQMKAAAQAQQTADARSKITQDANNQDLDALGKDISP